MEEIEFSGFVGLISLLVILLPLFSFLLILAGKKGKGANLALINISISFILSVYLFYFIWNKQPIHYQIPWFLIGDIEFKAGVLLNNLSVLMITLVSGISVLVHIYSRSYMKGDLNIHRYWAYLGLFCFSMLGLVISDNLLLIYLFWELVGFSSFLLIGFWYTKPIASQAAKKAFIMNRIGDIGFLLGIIIIFSQFRTLDITALFGDIGLVKASLFDKGLWISASRQMPEVWLSIAGLAFFIGAMAKSAQFPLHTWLPDAMEGPTAVSSLIHAATMVAAGVFLIARVYPVFDPFVLNSMVCIGAFTAFMAATIAISQNDIKRILAYSTISQLGFMVMALGIGAYSESIFHLATHAFFKCLLFLAAGSVIHQLHHYRNEYSLDLNCQDIRLMGGLRKGMPITLIGMCLASAALIGLPLSSGYLSKDAILIAAFEWAGSRNGIYKMIPYAMVITSWLTVFYISRLVFKVFFSAPKQMSREQADQIQDAPKQMSYVLLILAFFCLFFAFSLNPLSFESSWLWNGFSSSLFQKVKLYHWLIPMILNIGTVVLIFIAYKIYVKNDGMSISEKNIFHRFFKQEWYLNQLYRYLFTVPVEKFSRVCYWFDRNIIDALVLKSATLINILSAITHWFDRILVDGFVNALGTCAKWIGNFSRNFQTGKLQHYLISMLLVVLSFFILTYFI
jgi:NADH-quinone oxidoreductase subunit L